MTRIFYPVNKPPFDEKSEQRAEREKRDWEALGRLESLMADQEADIQVPVRNLSNSSIRNVNNMMLPSRLEDAHQPILCSQIPLNQSFD